MISLSVDPFIAVYADSNPFWTIDLTDGSTIYQDDDRPEVKEKSAWIRAKQYIYANDLEIERVKFRFAGYEHIVYAGQADGFYFAKGKSALLAGENSKDWSFYVAGLVNDDIMSVTRFEIPFLEKHDCFNRKVQAKNVPSIIIKREKRVHFANNWSNNN